MDRPFLNQLPNEIILRIFSFLPISSLPATSLVCKAWRALSDLSLSRREALPDSFFLKDHRRLRSILKRLPNLKNIPREIANLLHLIEVRKAITTSCPGITSVYKPSSVTALLHLAVEGGYSLLKVHLDTLTSIQELDSLVKLVSICPDVKLTLEWSRILAVNQPDCVLSRIEFLQWRNTDGMNELSIYLAIEKMKSLAGLSLTALFEWEDQLVKTLLLNLSGKLKHLRLTCSHRLLEAISSLKSLQSLSWCMPNSSQPQKVLLSLCQFLSASGSSLTELEMYGGVYATRNSSKREHESRVLLLSTIFNNCKNIRRLVVHNLFFSTLKADLRSLLVKPWTHSSLQPLLQVLAPHSGRNILQIEGGESKNHADQWLMQVADLPVQLVL